MIGFAEVFKKLSGLLERDSKQTADDLHAMIEMGKKWKETVDRLLPIDS